MSNVLQALAMALGGGAGALGQGFGQVGQNIERRRSAQQDDIFKQQQLGYQGQQVDIAREQATANTEHQRAMYANQQEQLENAKRMAAQQVAAATTADEHAKASEELRKLEVFAASYRDGNVTLFNPQRAYTRLNDPTTGSSALSALHTGMDKVGPMGNRPGAYVPGSDEIGGAMMQNRQFNPYAGQSGAWGDDALKFKNSQELRRALETSRAHIAAVKKNDFDAYSKTGAIPSLLGSVDETLKQRGWTEANTHAVTAARQAAQAELNTLQTMFGDGVAGLTVDMLMGDTPVGSGGAKPSTAPTNPNDPMGFGGGAARPPARAGAPPAPPQNIDPNDPLGLFRGAGRPAQASPPPTAGPRPVTPPPAFDPTDPLGLRRRP